MKILLALLLLVPGRIQAEEPLVRTGIDVLQERNFRDLKGKRFGLITNQTGVDAKGVLTARILAAATGAEMVALFAPEHGFKGLLESTSVASGRYLLPDGRDIPLYSLYGGTRAPTNKMLKGIDALVFDIQDIGTRFYTYATTMAYALEKAAELEIEFIVLDRPNPITGKKVEGPVLEIGDGLRSFISYFEIPTRHGLTIGEIARLHNFREKLGARLSVIPLKGWRRKMWFDDTGLPWVRPSPNMPNLASATLYPGIAGFEASNISVGRGTPIPFLWIGAPWMKASKIVRLVKKAKLKGVRFEAKTYTPTKSVFKGEKTHGIKMTITDRNVIKPFHIFTHLATALRDLHPDQFDIGSDRSSRLIGSKRFTAHYLSGSKAKEIIDLFENEAARFKAQREPFLLY
ncbi:MAG: hypothetical protein COB53_03555 [Elusimicrobia bacterium]|nr:MAG: hypothetical protein COB53_03555 [Elusimicrobiota bacterium]